MTVALNGVGASAGTEALTVTVAVFAGVSDSTDSATATMIAPSGSPDGSWTVAWSGTGAGVPTSAPAASLGCESGLCRFFASSTDLCSSSAPSFGERSDFEAPLRADFREGEDLSVPAVAAREESTLRLSDARGFIS
jgi:hypothetical protein